MSPPPTPQTHRVLSLKAFCSCTMPNKTLFKWFGVLFCLILSFKILVNLKCFLFCLGMPGLFGRNFLIYADQLQVENIFWFSSFKTAFEHLSCSIQDNSGEKLYHVTTNPVIVIINSIIVLLKTIFVSPCSWSVAFCKFYSRTYGEEPTKEALKRVPAANVK